MTLKMLQKLGNTERLTFYRFTDKYGFSYVLSSRMIAINLARRLPNLKYLRGLGFSVVSLNYYISHKFPYI